MSAIVIGGLGKSFGSGAKRVVALHDASLRMGENEFVALVGTSGCGKSTLLSIVAGLQEASEGLVTVDGAPVSGPGRDRGVVFQTYTLFPWLTARQNVEFALHGEGGSRAERRERAAELLDQMRLGEFADAYPRELSGGMKQRVAIARALVYRPRVLLMDEPFGALDALTRRMMQQLLAEVWETHRLTVLFVTHDVEEAVYVADRVLVMTNRPGRIKEEIPVPLPRPRTPEMLTDPAFMEIRGRVLESIIAEARAAEG
ncbi:MAG: ABC transporter ATP-binding protein [Thermoleophilia bacterium]|nr:ABC transporter ATP-binding protein [Thermoleophilia bacterium]